MLPNLLMFRCNRGVPTWTKRPRWGITLRVVLLLVFNGIFKENARSADFQPANSTLSFINLCTRQKIAFSTERKVGIFFKLDGIRPQLPVLIELFISPAGQSATVDTRRIIHIRKKIHPKKQQSSIEWTQTLKFVKNPTPAVDPETIWNAKLTWSQAESSFSGSASTNIRVNLENVNRLFQITGPLHCVWQTPTTIDSQYYENQGHDSMTITRDVTANFGTTALRGPDMGLWDYFVSQEHLSLLTYENPFNLYYPSVFFWESHFRVEHPKTWASKSWTLAQGEGGYITRRITFERYPATEITLQKSGKCPDWQPYRKGFLDIGKISTEFNLVSTGNPANESPGSPHSQDAFELLQSKYAPLNTCNQKSLGNSHAQFRIPTDQQELLFFYPHSFVEGNRI